MNLLVLFSSARQEGSVSRQVATHFLETLRTRVPAARVVTRDLGAFPVPPIDAAWTGANATPADQRSPEQRALLGLSDTLIAELRAADLILVATPMYNFGLPSPLKAWFDHVIRSGETFRFDPEKGAFAGLLVGKRAVVVTASAGDYGPGSPAASIDFLTPYVSFLLSFIGISETTTVAVPNTWGGPEAKEASMAKARAQLDELAGRLPPLTS